MSSSMWMSPQRSKVRADAVSSPIPEEPLNAILSLRGNGRLTAARQEERQAYVAPLFAYFESHGIIPIRVVRKAALRAGAGHITRERLRLIKNGRGVAPGWLIESVCLEIGHPVEIVMGEEWTKRYRSSLADGSEERAS